MSVAAGVEAGDELLAGQAVTHHCPDGVLCRGKGISRHPRPDHVVVSESPFLRAVVARAGGGHLVCRLLAAAVDRTPGPDWWTTSLRPLAILGALVGPPGLALVPAAAFLTDTAHTADPPQPDRPARS